MDLPEGVVTFLFSDVEASTSLLERHGALMGRALARHHEIFESVIAANEGVIFETVGDAVYAAFSRPAAAAMAALEVQHSLASEDWGPIERMRCRIAVHGGEVERRGDHYFGPSLFRAARLQAIGHGGQTLVSEVVAKLLEGSLPDTATLVNLGSHRLKDLAEPGVVYMLRRADDEADFPPLKSLDTRPNNLPIMSTTLVGRDDDARAVSSLLADHRLVTLVGPGGIGKTRLALQVAAERLLQHADGAFWIDLAPVTDERLVPSAVSAGLGLEEAEGDVARAMVRHLAERDVLLVLDNLEHLPGAAMTVAEWASAANASRILATSRGRLRLREEHVYGVSTLSMDRDSVGESHAVRLFLERVAQAGAARWASPAQTEVVAEICRHLDGLPLAIELAAARAPILSPAAMLDRLRQHLPVFGAGPRDVASRQRTLEGAIRWSYDLLEADAQAGFARLAVFAGPFSLDQAEAVDGSPDTIDMVEHLVDVGLVQAVPTEIETRFRMLETVRAFATERLVELGEADIARQRHARWFVSLAHEANRNLDGPDLPVWRDRLRIDLDNLRAAFGWLMGAATGEELGGFTASMERFWDVASSPSEGRRWIERALTSPNLEPVWKARLAMADARLATVQGRGTEGDALASAAVRTFEDIGVADDLCRALVTRSNARLMVGDFEGVRHDATRAIELARTVGDRRSEAAAVGNRALAALRDGDLVTAEADIERAVDLFRSIGHRRSAVMGVGNLVAIVSERGDYERARQLAVSGIREASDINDVGIVAWLESNLADIEFRLGNHGGAAALIARILPVMLELEDGIILRASLMTAGDLCARNQELRTAAALWAAATRLGDEAGSPVVTGDQENLLHHDARTRLGEEAWNEAAAASTQLTAPQVVDVAVAAMRSIELAAGPPASDSGAAAAT